MSRLVRIDHNRCGDYDGDSTYVTAPDDWNDAKIEEEVDAAQDAYLKDFAAAKVFLNTEAPPHPGYSPKWDDPINLTKTVAEVQADFAAKKAAYDEHSNTKRKFERRFEDYLVERGFKPIWDDDDTLETVVYWGHAHGSSYLYGTEIKGGIPGALTVLKEQAGKVNPIKRVRKVESVD